MEEKMQPCGFFQVDQATNVLFIILRGCFISEIALNLSFRWVQKLFAKSLPSLHVYTSLRTGVVHLSKKMSANQNAIR